MKKTVLFIAAICVFHSCKKEEAVSASQNVNSGVEKNISSGKMPPVYISPKKSNDEILAFMIKRKQDIAEILGQTPKEQSSELYIKYRKENDSALGILEQKNTALLEDLNNYYEYNDKTQESTLKLPSSLKPVEKKYNDAGVEFWSIGEGMHTVRMFPNFYQKVFSQNSSPELKQYLDNQAIEEKGLFSDDAAITVDWSEIERRILFREEILRKYPNTALKNTIKNELNFYRHSYILGMDNSPTLDEVGQGFSANYRKIFENFIAKNPQSETAIFLKSIINGKVDLDQLSKKIDESFGS